MTSSAKSPHTKSRHSSVALFFGDSKQSLAPILYDSWTAAPLSRIAAMPTKVAIFICLKFLIIRSNRARLLYQSRRFIRKGSWRQKQIDSRFLAFCQSWSLFSTHSLNFWASRDLRVFTISRTNLPMCSGSFLVICGSLSGSSASQYRICAPLWANSSAFMFVETFQVPLIQK